MNLISKRILSKKKNKLFKINSKVKMFKRNKFKKKKKLLLMMKKFRKIKIHFSIIQK